MNPSLEVLVESEGEATWLLAPSVGLFTCALPKGQLVVPGQSIGSLTTLGVAHTLTVPPGCAGKIANERFERVIEPVGFGTRLYELEPIGEGLDIAAVEVAAQTGSDLVVRSTHAGRFWHRPSPADDAFAKAGDIIEDGAVVGLVEVMKTFTHVHYHATGGLPTRAKILRFLVEDGAEAENGAPLFEVEPA